MFTKTIIFAGTIEDLRSHLDTSDSHYADVLQARDAASTRRNDSDADFSEWMQLVREARAILDARQRAKVRR